MPKGKAASSSDSNSPLRPPTSLEAQENLMISLAVQCAEKQLRDGTASSQVITHYLKLGSSKERIEKEILEKQIVDKENRTVARKEQQVTLDNNASFIDHGEKQEHIQEILNRCWDILEVLPASLLKLRLLTACYGEVYDEPLADEARKIIAGWDEKSLTLEQQEVIEEFQNVVDNPYLWEYIEE